MENEKLRKTTTIRLSFTEHEGISRISKRRKDTSVSSTIRGLVVSEIEREGNEVISNEINYLIYRKLTNTDIADLHKISIDNNDRTIQSTIIRLVKNEIKRVRNELKGE